MKDDRGEEDLTFLVEQHAKEIWALKEQVSKQSEELTVLRGTKDVVVRLTSELVRMKKRAQEAEGELTIIKGIGNTSPEMKALRARVKELGEINKLHQELNGRLQTSVTELEGDNKRLSRQIDDKNNFLDKIRRSGM